MNTAPDTAAGNGGTFDPLQAASLLHETTHRARRQFEPSPPWFLVTRGILVLVAYGAVWLSVRGQHPYTHPTAWALPGVFAFVVVNLAATLALRRRATAGVSGRSRLSQIDTVVLALVWIGTFIVLGALAGAGVSDRITYGLYPASAPLIAAGLAWAGIMAVRASWRSAVAGLAVTAVGIVAVFAGPAGSWAVDGIGLCIVLLAEAAANAWRQRA